MEAYKINHSDYESYLKKGRSQKLELIWSDVLIQFSQQEHRREARTKGYGLEKTGLSRFRITVPHGSSQLLKELQKIGSEVRLAS